MDASLIKKRKTPLRDSDQSSREMMDDGGKREAGKLRADVCGGVARGGGAVKGQNCGSSPFTLRDVNWSGQLRCPTMSSRVRLTLLRRERHKCVLLQSAKSTTKSAKSDQIRSGRDFNHSNNPKNKTFPRLCCRILRHNKRTNLLFLC